MSEHSTLEKQLEKNLETLSLVQTSTPSSEELMELLKKREQEIKELKSVRVREKSERRRVRGRREER